MACKREVKGEIRQKQNEQISILVYPGTKKLKQRVYRIFEIGISPLKVVLWFGQVEHKTDDNWMKCCKTM